MRSRTSLLLAAFCVALCAGDAALRAATAQPEQDVTRVDPQHPAPMAEAPPPHADDMEPILVSDPVSRLEFKLPAPYWFAYDRMQLAAQAAGGCGRGRLPENLLFICGHKDAPVQVWCIRGTDPFLMRDRDDLETFVNAVTDSVRSQVGESVEVLEQPGEAYSERDGMIIHRLGFTARAPAGGGCAGRPPADAQQERMAVLFVDYFLRPEGTDARNFRLICRGSVSPFEQLKPEIDFITSSLRYTGELADEFFVPDAPLEKVPTAKDAAKGAGSGRRGSGMWLAMAMILIIWFMIRRRKKAAA